MRPAFTLIELLVVISIMILLAGMILGAYGVVRRSAMRDRTVRIMQIVQQGLATARADRGGVPAAVAHPFAGSTAPRLAFVRQVGGAAVNMTTGWPYVGLPPGVITPASAEARLLLPDDRFSDAATCPMLYGMERSRLGVLGLALPDITSHLQATATSGRMPATAMVVHPGFADDGKAVSADPATTFTPSLVLRAAPSGGANYATASGRMVLMRQFWTGAFGSTDVASDLGRINGQWTPPDDDDAALRLDRRVWCGAVPDKASLALSGGQPLHYRLRGPAIYDAWGHEILYSVDGNGGTHFESAGPDGWFRWNPGKDAAFQTPAGAATALGDDRDGAADNIIEGALLR